MFYAPTIIAIICMLLKISYSYIISSKQLQMCCLWKEEVRFEKYYFHLSRLYNNLYENILNNYDSEMKLSVSLVLIRTSKVKQRNSRSSVKTWEGDVSCLIS